MNGEQRIRMRGEDNKRHETPCWRRRSYRMEVDKVPITKIAMAITIRVMYLELSKISE